MPIQSYPTSDIGALTPILPNGLNDIDMPTAKQIAAAAARNAAKAAQTSVPEVTPTISSWEDYDDLFDNEVTEDLTFHISDVKHKDSGTGNRYYKVRTDQDTVISFWTTTRNLCIEVDVKGNCSLIPGTTITKKGSLIPPGKGNQGDFGDDIIV